MKDNILLINLRWLEPYADRVKRECPSILVTDNFEDILARAKLDEINRLCIILSAFNYSGSKSNCILAQDAAELIHAVRSEIPILVWSGRRPGADPVKKENELYLESEDYTSAQTFEIIRRFFSGSLTLEDVPKRSFLSLNF